MGGGEGGGGGLGKGDPLWIFFAFVFNAVWEQSSPTPHHATPLGPEAEEGCCPPPRPAENLPHHRHRTRPSPITPPVLCSRHCYAK